MKQNITLLKLITIICSILIFLIACTKNDQSGHPAPIKIDRSIILQHVDRQYEFYDGLFTEEVMYYALGKHGEYFFAPGNWDTEYMLYLATISEDCINFTKNWLNYKDETLIPVVYGSMDDELVNHTNSILSNFWGGYYGFGNIFINYDKEKMPTIICHEAAHATIRLQDLQTNFPFPPVNSKWHDSQFLEEGLCYAIEYLYFLESKHLYYFSNRDESIIDKESNIPQLHKWALDAFNDYNFDDESQFGNVYPQLMSFETASSFVYFLLEHKGTKDDFMRFYGNINLMEEIYGVSMDIMIAQWLAFLEQCR